MLRLRVFRILLPGSLIVFVGLLFLTLRDRPVVHGPIGPKLSDSNRSAEEFEFVELEGANTTLEFKAELVREQREGQLHLEQIRELIINREDGAPLVLSSEIGDIEGQPGERTMRFERDVVVRDPDNGLVLTLPMLDVDEKLAEARSSGEIVFTGPTSEGRAAGVLYRLDGRPAEVDSPEVWTEDGARLRADQAVLLDGLDDVELVGRVEATRSEDRFTSDRLRVFRDPSGRVRRAKAEGAVRGSLLLEDGSTGILDADRADSRWDRQGELEQIDLNGSASVRQGERRLAAATIHAERGETGTWELKAEGEVRARASILAGRAELQCETLTVELDADRQPLGAHAEGDVVINGPDTRASSDTARFVPGDPEGEIQLYGTDRTKARLARGSTRVAASRIFTDRRGEGLVAIERVEATMLPEKGTASEAAVGVFRVEEAVHFVAERLDGEAYGSRLRFSGRVRAWQGEQNLAAEMVQLERDGRRMLAEENVTTRLPRDASGPALSEADYVQISAAKLTYEGTQGVAVYEQDVRVELVEGWLEALRIEVEMRGEDEGGGIRELRAHEDVRIEFRLENDEGEPELVEGRADRLVYTPQDHTVRLFGDAKPAMVRRMGVAAGTTTGRVLRYRLDSGTLEVDASGKSPAKIRTKGS